MAYFSVITPCYNAQKYIKNCVESVKYCLSGMDYEHIIVDGKSNDNTLHYLDQQKNIKVISESDQGMYDALNKGIAASQGVLIGHLNTDEQYNRHALLKALNYCRREKAIDAIFSPTIMVDSNLFFLQLFNQVVVPRVVDTHWGMPVQSCSLLYKRSLWERYKYNATFRLAGDHEWFRWQMEHGLHIQGIRSPIGIFTWHSNNLSMTDGPFSTEYVLQDINKNSWKISFAKRIYRLKKLLLGGYLPIPITYDIYADDMIKHRRITIPILKIRNQ